MLGALARSAWLGPSRWVKRTPLVSSTRSISAALGAPGKVVELKTEADYSEAMKNLGTGGGAILDFTAKWCGPCKAISPIYEKLAANNEDIAFYKIDVDNSDMTSAIQNAGVTAVPTFVGYRGQTPIEGFSGANRAQLDALVAKVQGK